MVEIDLTLVELYLDELRLLLGRANNTIDAYYFDLRRLAIALQNKDVALLGATELDLLEVFNDYSLSLSKSSTLRAVSSARSFYGYLANTRLIETSPMSKIEQPSRAVSLPGVLSVDQVDAFMGVIGLNTRFGIRDRTLFELIYGSGLRVSEAVGANLEDVYFDDKVLRVIGKGSKPRFVPLTLTCANYLDTYIFGGVRKRLEAKKPSNAIFYSARGSRITRQAIWQLTKKYATASSLGTEIHPHTLRHSCATHMVNNGADLRVVQEMLGHVSVATTQIYTHVAPQRLINVFQECHPRAKTGEISALEKDQSLK